MKYLIRTCHKLRHLELTGSGFIGDSLTAALPLARGLETLIVSAGVEIRFTDVQKSLSICRATLVETSFLDIVETQLVSKWEKLPRLNTLQLRFQKATLLNLVSLEYFLIGPLFIKYSTRGGNLCLTHFQDGLGESFANIRSLTVCKWHNPTISGLVDLTGLTNLHDLALIDTYITFFRELPLTIKRLNFSKSIIDIQSQDDSSYRLPLLERLDCSKALIFPSFLKAITHESIKVGNFKQLYMGGRLMRPSIVGDEYPPSSTVEELSLASLPMKEEALINITNLYPNLRWLDVSETKVTGVAVKHFINVGIKWLGLNECTEVSSDAVEFARGKGVEVAFMFPSRSAAFKSSFRGSSWRGAF
jgi:F-box/TPR repeat protein Pof3